MKQKIVIKVILACEKCRREAFKTAGDAPGVISVAVQGKENDELVIVGNEVDAVCLTSGLRKKVRYANLVGVSEVKPPEESKPKPSAPVADVKPKPKPNPPTPNYYPPSPYVPYSYPYSNQQYHSLPTQYPSLPTVYLCESSYPKFW